MRVPPPSSDSSRWLTRTSTPTSGTSVSSSKPRSPSTHMSRNDNAVRSGSTIVAVVPAANGPFSLTRLTPAFHSGQLATSARIANRVAALAVLSVRYSFVHIGARLLISKRAYDKHVYYTLVKSADLAARHCCVGRRLRVEHTVTVIVSSLKTSSAPAGYRFPREVIAVAVRWYLRYGLSYRDVEELLAERGIDVDHVTVYRWVQTFTAEFIDAARAARHAVGSRWFLDETYVKIAGRWQYLYRAIDQHGQVIDVLVSPRPRRGPSSRAHCGVGHRQARS